MRRPSSPARSPTGRARPPARFPDGLSAGRGPRRWRWRRSRPMVRVLEPACEWRAAEVADPAAWTEVLSDAEVAELDGAIAHARSVSDDLMAIGAGDFPL